MTFHIVHRREPCTQWQRFTITRYSQKFQIMKFCSVKSSSNSRLIFYKPDSCSNYLSEFLKPYFLHLYHAIYPVFIKITSPGWGQSSRSLCGCHKNSIFLLKGDCLFTGLLKIVMCPFLYLFSLSFYVK